QAEQDVAMAQAYFNFLLNRDYTEPIELMPLPEAFSLPTLEGAQQEAWQQRDELTQFNHYLAISDNQIDLFKGNNLPTINLVGDYGFQGVDYSFGPDDDFLMGSLVLSWPIFNRTTKAKVQQAQIDKSRIQSQKSEVRQQIGLQVIETWYQARTALQQMDLSNSEIKSAQGAYQLVEKKFRQGQANLVELTDARTQLTNAQRRKIIAEFDIQVKLAELEWVLGKDLAQ
ncbi:MAG: TolC family protein, partial [Bacteroidota bacterium]